MCHKSTNAITTAETAQSAKEKFLQTIDEMRLLKEAILEHGEDAANHLYADADADWMTQLTDYPDEACGTSHKE